jgi:hypothetical protein
MADEMWWIGFTKRLWDATRGRRQLGVGHGAARCRSEIDI